MGETNIEWTDTTWNPVRGCSKVSPGCQNCYAERTAARQAHSGYAGLVRIGEGSPRWTGEVRLVPGKLDEPRRWRKPRRIFVNSMSDLFHEKLTDAEIARVFDAMRLAPQHTYQVLTKRAGRMRDALPGWFIEQPLPNVWLGVSVENQAAADERIQCLLETPAAVRFLSVEPLLGPVSLDHVAWLWRCENCGEAKPPVSDPSSVRWRWRGDLWQHLCASSHPQAGAWDARRFSGIDWVIVGGESGPGARPCHLSWIRSVVEQCKAAGVPCFVKQLGADPRATLSADLEEDATFKAYCVDDGRDWPMGLADRKGGNMSEWPDDLCVRQFPVRP